MVEIIDKENLGILIKGGQELIYFDLSEDSLQEYMDKHGIVDREEGKIKFKEEIETLIDMAEKGPEHISKMIVDMLSIKRGRL